MTMNRRFRKAIMLAVLAVVAIALFDVLSATSGVFGTIENYTNGDFSPGWWPLFFKLNLILITVIPISYFFFGRRDKSEAIALFFTSLVLWFAGLADIFYFWLQGKMVPSTLPWLENGIIIGRVSEILGFETVTNISLFASVIVGFIGVYFLDKWLEGIN